MIRLHGQKACASFGLVAAVTVLATNIVAQNQGGGGTASVYDFTRNYHLGFNQPEAWGLKYFASASLLSGLQPPETTEGHRVGSISLAFEVGYLPTLDTGQRLIGFNGT